jgi:curli biogenesis system outer membrane secretion channel CsgG
MRLPIPTQLRPLPIILAASLLGLGSLANAQEAGSDVEKCSKKLGTIAVSEPRDGLSNLSRYGLGSPNTLLRMMIQQSGCFDVLERGQAFADLQRERALAGNGELMEGSNVGKGQLQAADFVLTPGVQFAENTGGVGGAVAGLFGMARGVLGQIGGLAGGVKFKEAQTAILIADIRSGIQVASAEGTAKKTDFNIGGWGYGAGAFASAGGYTRTHEGKVVAASFLDNFNKIVTQIRDQPSLVRSSSAASQQNAAASTRATGVAPQVYATPVAIAPVIVMQQPPIQQQQPQQLQQTAANSQGFYKGSFEGGDNGQFVVTLDGAGNIAGTGVSATGGNFGIRGKYKSFPNRTEIEMGSTGDAGGATFTGFIQQASGVINGMWMLPKGGTMVTGSFKGQREN